MAPGETVEAAASDLELMWAIAERRDRAAFAILFGRYAPRLKAFLMRGGLAAAVAEEIVQDVMLTAWQRAGSFDPALAGASTWLFTIARNRRIDHFRRTRGGDAPLDPELEAGPELAADGLVERQNSHISLRTAIKALPPEQADVVRLAFFEQKSHSMIAQERQLPLGTVKSRIRLALRQLRRSFEAPA